MKKNFLLGLLIAFVLGFSLMGCPQSGGGTQNNNHNNPVTPDNPDTPVAKSLISKVLIQSANGYKDVPYSGAIMNTKGKVQMKVALKSGIDAETAKIVAKLAGSDVAFGEFNESWDGVSSICENVQGITAEAKEMVITVTSGKNTDIFKLKLKEFDESALEEIQLLNFFIGGNDPNNDIGGTLVNSDKSFRIYDPSSKEIEFEAKVDHDLKKAIIVVNGKQTDLQPTEDAKDTVKAKVAFEDNSVKIISFTFQAENCKDLITKSLSLTFTNKLNAIVEVDATGRDFKGLTDAEIMSGSVAFNKCTTTQPKIKVTAMKSRDAVLTSVTFDGVAGEIAKEMEGTPDEMYVATYTLSPALEKAGDKREVKVHFEGTNKDGSQVKEATDLTVSFTLVQFIEASMELEADTKPYTALQDGHRVYSPSVKLKVISKNDKLTDVVVKDYKDADDKTPEFEISEKEAVANIKLKDTGMAPTTFKIVLSAEGKTDTVLNASIRYTAENDPLSFFHVSFEAGSIEKIVNPSDPRVMTGDEAKAYVLLGRNVKEVTSIKVNGVEVMGKSKADPDKIVLEANFTVTQGQGGRNTNAVFLFGGDEMRQNEVYTLTISMAGKDDDGHILAENTLPPLKIKKPAFDPKNTDWISPYGTENEAMEFIEMSKSYHPEDKAQLFYNYYGIKSYTFAVRTKNPKAKVKGIWYRHDTNCTERDAILKDTQEENGTYEKHFLKFTEQQTILGKCKWCTTLDFDDDDKKDFGISVYLWVVSEDGTKTTKEVECDDTIHTPWEQNFRRLDIMFDYENHEGAGWEDVGDKKGWKHATQVIDVAEIDYSKVKENKLYFRAASFSWVAGQIEYHLFAENDQVTSPILDFKRTEDARQFDNRFTVDVSSIKNATVGTAEAEMEVSIPLYMKSLTPGKNFTANVFTRKFKIVKKS